MGGLIPLTGVPVLAFGCEPIYTIRPARDPVLRRFQTPRTPSCSAGSPQGPKAITCPISERVFRYFFVNFPSSRREERK